MGARGPGKSFGAMTGTAPGRDPGHRPQPSLPVAFRCGEVDRPEGMDPEAAAVWDRLLPELQSAGRNYIAPVDGVMFAMLCTEIARWWALGKTLKEEGWTYECATGKGGKMWRKRPEGEMYQEALDNVAKLGAKFGITPGDRMRIEYSGDAPEAMIEMLPGWGAATKGERGERGEKTGTGDEGTM